MSAQANSEIKIKFLSKYKPGHDGEGWLKMFPSNTPRWGNCYFIFDRHCRDYDWLVVYDDLPSVAGERHPLWEEALACNPRHTLLITTEPSSIKVYGKAYLKQYQWVLSSQESWALGHHPGQIFEQPALIWFYADTPPRCDYDTILSHVPTAKTLDVSTVCSSKRQGNTLHRTRYDFTQALKALLPQLDIYGHGVRPLVDKADALDDYRYHLAIENFSGPHHWTEKLSDAFLGGCLPFYYGCTNLNDYFPADSFVLIDINDPEKTAKLLQQAIQENWYEKRLPAILQSRRLVLEKYGTIATITRLVNKRHSASESRSVDQKTTIKSRRRTNKNPINAIHYLLEKQINRLKN